MEVIRPTAHSFSRADLSPFINKTSSVIADVAKGFFLMLAGVTAVFILTRFLSQLWQQKTIMPIFPSWSDCGAIDLTEESRQLLLERSTRAAIASQSVEKINEIICHLTNRRNVALIGNVGKTSLLLALVEKLKDSNIRKRVICLKAVEFQRMQVAHSWQNYVSKIIELTKKLKKDSNFILCIDDFFHMVYQINGANNIDVFADLLKSIFEGNTPVIFTATPKQLKDAIELHLPWIQHNCEYITFSHWNDAEQLLTLRCSFESQDSNYLKEDEIYETAIDLSHTFKPESRVSALKILNGAIAKSKSEGKSKLTVADIKAFAEEMTQLDRKIEDSSIKWEEFGVNLTKKYFSDPPLERASGESADKALLQMRTYIEKERKNVILVGKIGKTSLINRFVCELAESNPQTTVIALEYLKFLLQTNSLREKIEKLINILKKNSNFILCLDKFSGCEDLYPTPSSLIQLLKPIFEGICPVILINAGNTLQPELSSVERLCEKIKLNDLDIPLQTSLLDKALSESQIRCEDCDKVVARAVYLGKRYPMDTPFMAMKILKQAIANAKSDNEEPLKIEHIQKAFSQISGINPLSGINIDAIKIRMNAALLNQSRAIDAVCNAFLRVKTEMRIPGKPLSFLFVGPTGCGKTELAKHVALEMYGSKQALIRIDMTSYKEPHNVSSFLGAPPGFIYADRPSGIKQSLSGKSQSVILLDEIEKAHPDVMDVFMTALDEGFIKDRSGFEIDCRDACFILTSNLGSDLRGRALLSQDGLKQNIREALSSQFKPEVINRLSDIVFFNPIEDSQVGDLLKLKIENFKSDSPGCKDITFDLEDPIYPFLKSQGYDRAAGTRALERTIEHCIGTALARAIQTHPSVKKFLGKLKGDQIVFETTM